MFFIRQKIKVLHNAMSDRKSNDDGEIIIMWTILFIYQKYQTYNI